MFPEQYFCLCNSHPIVCFHYVDTLIHCAMKYVLDIFVISLSCSDKYKLFCLVGVYILLNPKLSYDDRRFQA